MLAHLTRKRFVRGNARTGELEYEDCQLRWSGEQAQGDEFSAPVEVVIECSKALVINSENKLVRHSEEYEYTPARLWYFARNEQHGFNLLYDEQLEPAEIVEETANA